MNATPFDSGSQEEAALPAQPIQVGAGIDFADPTSRLAPYYLRLSQVIAVGLIAATFLLICSVPLWHTDIWGHLKFGQWIFEHQELPLKDPSCPFADDENGVRYPGQLGQAALYLIFHMGELTSGGDELERLAGGVAALRLTHALIVALRLCIMLAAFRRVSGSCSVACAALAVLLLLSVGNIAIMRPQIVGELFFALLLFALSRPVLSGRQLIFIPILFAIWGNAHGSFGAGLLLIAAVLLGRAIDVVRTNGRFGAAGLWRDAPCRRLAAVLAASALAVGCCNPSGFFIFGQVLAMARHPVVRLQDEWQPLIGQRGGGLWMYAAFAVLLVATQVRCTRWFSSTSLVLIVVFALQPLWHQRMFTWWLMVAPWVMAAYWPDCKPGWFGRWTKIRSVPSLRKTLLAAGVVFVTALWSIPGQWIVSGSPGGLDRSVSGGTCWQLTAVLRDPRRRPPTGYEALAKDLQDGYPHQVFTGCIFASETLGDYLIWQLAPEVPVFVYTHAHLFKLAHWRDAMIVRAGAKGWREILDRHWVNLVVVEPSWNPQLCEQLRHDPLWHVVLDESDVTNKRGPGNRLFVALRKSPLRSQASRDGGSAIEMCRRDFSSYLGHVTDPTGKGHFPWSVGVGEGADES
jgi:hypothetical protein